MPLIKSAIKRMRQTAKRRARNTTTKREMRSAVKTYLANPSTEGLRAAQSEIDGAVKKNILEKNTAARRKAALVRVAKKANLKPPARPARQAGTATKAKKTTAAKPAAAKSPAKKTVAKKAAAKQPATKKPAAKKAAPKPARPARQAGPTKK